MTITPVPTGGFPHTRRPWNNITPFTYRDGLTYLEVLEALRAWVRNVLVPHIDGEMAEVVEHWENLHSEFEEHVLSVFAEWQGEFDDFTANIQTLVDQWTSVQIENNDVITEQIVSDPESATRSALADIMPYVNVLDHGAIGDGIADETVAVQAAIDAASAEGRAVFMPGGAYRITSTVTLPSGTTLSGVAGATVLDISGMADNTPAIAATGTFEAEQPLPADIAEGDTSMTLASVTGLAVGDYLKISSSQTFGSTSQLRGEFVRIRSIDGGVVTFEDALHDSYPVASGGKFEKATFVEGVSIEGVKFVGPSTVRNVIGASFTLCRNVSVSGVRAKHVHNAAIHMWDVVESSVSDSHFADAKLPGFAYGVAILSATQDITIANCTGVRLRHLITTGGGAGRRGLSRRIAVSNCTASQMDDAGFDAHPSSEYVSFIGCHVNGSNSVGITMQSSRFVISGCTVSGSASHGIMVQPLTIRGVDGIVSNNRVHGAGGRGISIRINADAEYRQWSGLSITGNVVTDAQYGIDLDNASSEFNVPGVVVSANTVRGTFFSHGIYLRGATGAVVNGNHVSGSGGSSEVLYLRNSPESVVSGNILDGAGVSVRCLRLYESADSTVTGNLLRDATAQGVSSDDVSNNVVYMGNRNLCTTKGSLSGTGHLQSTDDAGGAYNL